MTTHPPLKETTNTVKQSKLIFFKKLLFSILIWFGASIFFGLIRVWGVESLPAFERVQPFDIYLFSRQILVLGLATGIPFGITDYFLDTPNIRKLPYFKLIAIKVVAQIIIAVFSLAVLVFFNNYFTTYKISMMSFVFSKTTLLWIFFTGLVSFIIYFFEILKTKIGKRMLINLWLGKYHNPRVETRIFMFLDMKDSTTHAENLGHIKFSSLIQDSLNDLTEAIIQHKVEVYQYVGDEAILTWNLQDGFDHNNCVQIYFTFLRTLQSKKTYYENNYGFVPFFKAGVHLGEVTVSEVGIIKREIAYHSDVLNTAARIQGKCNEFKAGVLISEELKNKLSPTYYHYEHIGGIALKGKQQLVNIYKLSLK